MHEPEWDLLNRYLSGECDANERARFEAWRDALPERQVLVRALLRETVEEPALPLLTPSDWADMRARLAGTFAGRRTDVVPSRHFLFFSRRSWLNSGVAAALALLLAGAVARGVLVSKHESTSIGTTSSFEHTLRTSRGQQATFRLPDGTRVVLGPSSTLWYSTNFGGHTRDVSLQGQAYFAVVHDERRPFRVTAADLVAQDLGTQFTVRAYAEDAHAIVAVREGEVGIRATTATDKTVRVVAAGELGRLSDEGTAIVFTTGLDRYFTWLHGKLVFDDVPLREVLPDLSRWFGLDLRLSDSTAGHIPVSATLEKSPTPDVLDNMAAAVGLVAIRTGHVVYFRRPVFDADSVGRQVR